MPNKPNKWIAVLLVIFFPPIALMYVGRLGWAGIYLLVAFAVGVLEEFFLRETFIEAVISVTFMVICVVHVYRLALNYPNERLRPAYSRWYGLLGTAAGWILVAFVIRIFIVEPFYVPSGSMLPTIIPQQTHLIVQKWGYGNYGTHYGFYDIHLFRLPISASLRRGDIIVFEFPQDRSVHYVKRLIGLPGDKIDYRGKKLSINGEPVALRQTTDYFDSKTLLSTPMFIESLESIEYPILLRNNAPSNIVAPLTFPFSEKCSYDSEGIICVVPEGHYFTLGDNRDDSSDSRMWGFVPADHIIGKILYVVP